MKLMRVIVNEYYFLRSVKNMIFNNMLNLNDSFQDFDEEDDLSTDNLELNDEESEEDYLDLGEDDAEYGDEDEEDLYSEGPSDQSL
jgi:hypothetical protein